MAAKMCDKCPGFYSDKHFISLLSVFCSLYAEIPNLLRSLAEIFPAVNEKNPPTLAEGAFATAAFLLADTKV